METVIVDGYNVIHAWPELKAELTRGPLEAARRRLIAVLAEYAAVRHVQVTVVFDGPRAATGPEVEVIDGVSVRFSGRSGSADHLIERLAYDAARAGDMVTVATSDRLQRDIVRAIGGVTTDATSFEQEVRAALAETSEGVTRLREVARLSQRVEDVIPREVAEQLDAIRRGVAAAGATGDERGGAARVEHFRPRAYEVREIGRVESPIVDRRAAPKQGDEGAPDAWIVFDEAVADALRDLRAGDEVIVLTWLDRATRSVLRVHPRGDTARPQEGVFSTRSPDRPNPIGLHRVTILSIEGTRMRVRNLEALDGTPVLDVKPVLDAGRER